MPLTQTESWYLTECIKGETLMCQKLSKYLAEAQDPNLRSIIDNLQRTCQRHVETLTDSIVK